MRKAFAFLLRIDHPSIAHTLRCLCNGQHFIVLMITLTSRVLTAFLTTQISRRRMMGSLLSFSVAASTSEDGYVTVYRHKERFSLYYRMYYKKESSSTPLVVLHGGPSLPSQYLYPIVDHIERPILFYDQLGCGKSDEPKQPDYYSISQSIEDLECVLEQLSLPHVHLLGHSYGGNVAYEYVRHYPARVASLILSNTGTDMSKTLQEYYRLQKANPNKFWNTHACRVGMPESLKDAMQHGGTVWSGMNVVADYKAEPLASSSPPPTLLIQTRHDFGAAVSRNWQDLLPIEQEVMLENCAHYPHLEEGATFGKVINDFMQRHDK